MRLKDRLTGIDVNLDDLQAGAEAGSRAAEHIQSDAAALDRLEVKHVTSAALLSSIVDHAKELQTCAREQEEALKQLRIDVARLREALKVESSTRTVRTSQDAASDR